LVKEQQNADAAAGASEIPDEFKVGKSAVAIGSDGGNQPPRQI
jgi:hypothetical protein